MRTKRCASACLFAAVEPATGAKVALVRPTVSTAAMSRCRAGLSAALAPGAPAVLVLDQAGWHGARARVAPPNLTLVPLPPCSPELNPVERVWLCLRERYPPHRLREDPEAVAHARLAPPGPGPPQEPGRIQSLTSHPRPPP